MKRYLVEVRLGYDVRADSADEALKLVSSGIQDDETIAVEYSVRERHEAAPPIESKSPDLHGLTKPVYTVTEVASILGTSRSSVYELARRSGSSTRLGRRVLIPRNTLVAFLNGELPLKEPVPPEPVSRSRPMRRNPVKKSTLPEAVTPVRRPPEKREVKEKELGKRHGGGEDPAHLNESGSRTNGPAEDLLHRILREAHDPKRGDRELRQRPASDNNARAEHRLLSRKQSNGC